MTIEQAKHLREIIEQVIQTLKDDKTALEATMLFPEWKAGVDYAEGVRVKHNSILYKVLTAHTSQYGWAPDVAASLFAKVLIPDENVIPAWEQPDSTNPYMIGDKVSHNGKIWISTVDNNVWEPAYYGWQEING